MGNNTIEFDIESGVATLTLKPSKSTQQLHHSNARRNPRGHAHGQGRCQYPLPGDYRCRVVVFAPGRISVTGLYQLIVVRLTWANP